MMTKEKRYTLKVTDHDTGKEQTFHLEGFIVFGIQERIKSGLIAANMTFALSKNEINMMLAQYIESENLSSGKKTNFEKEKENLSTPEARGLFSFITDGMINDLVKSISHKEDCDCMDCTMRSVMNEASTDHSTSEKECDCSVCVLKRRFEEQLLQETQEEKVSEPHSEEEQEECDCLFCQIKAAMAGSTKEEVASSGTVDEFPFENKQGPSVSGSTE